MEETGHLSSKLLNLGGGVKWVMGVVKRYRTFEKTLTSDRFSTIGNIKVVSP